MKTNGYLVAAAVALVTFVWLTQQPDTSDARLSTLATIPTRLEADEPLNVEPVSVPPIAAVSATDEQKPKLTVQAQASSHYDKACTGICERVLDLIAEHPMSDTALEAALGDTESLAAQLRGNPKRISQWIAIATRAEGNRRNLILATFAQLNIRAQHALGEALLNAPSFTHRIDGAQVLAAEGVMTQQHGQLLAARLVTEHNKYVRGALVRALSEPQRFLNNSEIIASLEHIRLNDSDYELRGEALLATAYLQEQSHATLHHSIEAIRSGVGIYQEYGAQALQTIIARQSLGEGTTSLEQQRVLARLKERLMEPEFDELPATVRATIDNL